MNTVIQNSLVFIAVTLAIVFLIRKFFWKPKTKTSKVCEMDTNCDCY